MDTATTTFEEVLYNGRYHIIGGVLLLVFVVAFIRETIRELMIVRAERRQLAHRNAFGPLFHDAMIGPVMADGGEPFNDEAPGGEVPRS